MLGRLLCACLGSLILAHASPAAAEEEDPAVPEDLAPIIEPVPPSPAPTPVPEAGPPLPGATFHEQAPPPTSALRKTAWVSAGSSLALATIGATLALSAQSREEDLDNLLRFRDADGNPAVYDARTRERYDDLASEGRGLQIAALASFIVSGALAGTAVACFLLDSDGADAPRPRVMLDRDDVRIAAEWSF